MPHRALPPSIALAAYAESLVEGRRVLVFGNASSGFADDLVERGARLVHVYDEDSDRAAEARARSDGRSILYAPLTEAGLALRQAAFDIGIIENLAAAHDAAARIRELKHALTPRGAALIATPNPDVKLRLLAESEPRVVSFDYYALFDLVSSEFSLVRMLGQAPFVGYAVVDFAPDGEPEPSFDNGFVPGGSEEPEWFVALASSHRVRLEEFGVIQLSLRQTLASLSERSGLDRRPRAVETEIAGLRSELARREQAMANLEQRVASAEAHADSLQDEMDGLRGDLVRAERASILPPSPTEAPSAPSEPSAPVSLAKPAIVQELVREALMPWSPEARTHGRPIPSRVDFRRTPSRSIGIARSFTMLSDVTVMEQRVLATTCNVRVAAGRRAAARTRNTLGSRLAQRLLHLDSSSNRPPAQVG